MSALPVESITVLASTMPRPSGVATTTPVTTPFSTRAPQPNAPIQTRVPACRLARRHHSAFPTTELAERSLSTPRSTSLVKPPR